MKPNLLTFSIVGHGNQDFLISAQEQMLSPSEYEEHFGNMRRLSTKEGIDLMLDKYGIDVIIGPADSSLCSLASCSGKQYTQILFKFSRLQNTGYPIAVMPLSYLDFNGRPFGMAVLAREHQDELLVKVLSAWEATFPARRPPPLLQE
jgi:amidase